MLAVVGSGIAGVLLTATSVSAEPNFDENGWHNPGPPGPNQPGHPVSTIYDEGNPDVDGDGVTSFYYSNDTTEAVCVAWLGGSRENPQEYRVHYYPGQRQFIGNDYENPVVEDTYHPANAAGEGGVRRKFVDELPVGTNCSNTAGPIWSE